jgi:hypothetical protein
MKPVLAACARALQRPLRVLLCVSILNAPLAAQSVTIADIFAGLNEGASRINFAASDPDLVQHIQSLETFMRQLGAYNYGVDVAADVFTGATPGYVSVLRVNKGQYELWSRTGLRDSLIMLKRIANGTLRQKLNATLGDTARKRLYAPLDTFDLRILSAGVALNTERLRRYEIRYGLNSPTFNLAEAGLNYAAQLWLPSLFGGTVDGPSRNEIVATYRTTDLTASTDSTAIRIVTSAQLALRRYTYWQDCGTGNALQKVVRPCHYSVGWFVMAAKETPLRSLLRERTQSGIYVSSGNYHLGIIPSNDAKVVFGVDTKILPFVF